MATDASSPYQVDGLIDDDRSKRNLRLLRLPVLGGRKRLLDIAAEKDATTVILADHQCQFGADS